MRYGKNGRTREQKQETICLERNIWKRLDVDVLSKSNQYPRPIPIKLPHVVGAQLKRLIASGHIEEANEAKKD